MRRALTKLVKVIGWAIVSIVAVVCLALCVAVSVAGTSWGHRHLLAAVMPSLASRVDGSVRIGHLDGTLYSGLVLDDVEIDDREGRPAVRARRITVRYALLPLIRHSLQINELRVDALRVYARPLRDGRLNLGTLIKDTPPSPPDPNPLRIVVRRVVAESELHYEAPPDAGELLQRGALARLRLVGSVQLAGEKTHVALEELSAISELPARATVSLAGGLLVEGDHVSLEAVTLSLAGRGEDVGVLVPAARLRGLLRARLEASGALDQLAVHAAIVPASGALDVKGHLALHGSQLTWSGHVSARDIDPAAATALAPHGTIALDADAKGLDGTGTVQLAQLDARSLDARLLASGESDLAGFGHIDASVTANDLARLSAVGAPALAGALNAHAAVTRSKDHFAIDAQINGRSLGQGTLHLAQLKLTAHVVDFLGDLSLEARGLHAASQTLDVIHLIAHADRRTASAHLDARGPHQLELNLALSGRPLLRGTTPMGADVQLTRLVLARRGERWQSAQPAHLRVDSQLSIARLLLVSGAQRIALDARYALDNKTIDATLKTQKVDIARVMRLVSDPGNIPSTSIDAEARISGPIAAPVVVASIAAIADKVDRFGHVELHAKARYGEERVRGELAATAMAAGVNATFDLPTTIHAARAPLSLDVATHRVQLSTLHALLPALFADVEGKVELHVHAQGTLDTPSLQLTLRSPDWQIGQASVDGAPLKSDTLLQLSYKDGALALHETTTLGGKTGALDADATLPIDLRRAIASPARAWKELEDSANINASIAARGIDLERLPFEYVGLTRPVSTGVVDASLQWQGPLGAPSVHVAVKAKNVSKETVVDRVDLSCDAQFLDKQLTLTGGLDLRGQRLIDLHGQTAIDLKRALAGQEWRQTPLALDVTIPRYDLARLRGMRPELDSLAGTLEAAVHVTGTLVEQAVTATLGVDGLQLATARFSRLTLTGGLARQRVTIALDADQTTGGTLHASGAIPLDEASPWQIALHASRFDLQFLSGALADLRSAKGSLAADITIAGSRATPTLEARVQLHDGGFQLRIDPHPYDKIQLDARVHNGGFDLSTLKVTSGDGTLSLTGHADLQGFVPTRGDFQAETHRFALVLGSMAAWLDSDIGVHLSGNAKQLHARIDMKKGMVRLPQIASSRALQATGTPPHVVFVDQQAKKEALARAAAKAGEASTASVSAHIPGPFYIRSKEVNAELKGDLELAVNGPEMTLNGTVETAGGWIELLSQRYVIDHARVGFAGPPESPNLDVRLTRELHEATLVIEVHGTGSKPTLELFSDPPIYDKSQILGIILSGDPSGQQVSDRALDQKVVGAMSGLVLGKLKDTISPSLPIDVIHVKTGDSGYTGAEQTQVEVGKFITESLYVSYVHQFGQPAIAGATNSNEARAEYRFKRHYEADTTFGDAGIAGIDLFWTLRY